MSITRVGTNERYAAGWERVFGGRKQEKKTPAKSSGANVRTKAAAPSKKRDAKKKKPSRKC